MVKLLHIDTALEKAFVGLSRDGVLIGDIENAVQYDHAAFVQPAIRHILDKCNFSINDIDAVGITIGPGSYTGLRVGMASAKGICYALNKPLLAVTTLEAMTFAAIGAFPGFDAYCPMIDARRDEVYMALYETAMKPIIAPRAARLPMHFPALELQNSKILFFGTGAAKWKEINAFGPNASFEQVAYNGKHLAQLLLKSFKNNLFCDLAYTDPFYIKDFHFAAPRKSS